MSETNEEKVERFIDFNRSMIASACAEPNLRDQGIRAKVLLCAIIDSLGKSRFPEVQQNGARFIRTISVSANWRDCERISLLHLKRAMEVLDSLPEEFASLSKWAGDESQSRFRDTGRMLSARMPISRDPLPEEVMSLWPADGQGNLKKLGSVSYEKLQHKSLLWLYRNALMHEYRIPGRASEFGAERSEPHYQQVSHVEDICPQAGIIFTNSWELLYPTGFFRQLTANILSEVTKHHLAEGTSPFSAYSDGSYWIPAFNQEC